MSSVLEVDIEHRLGAFELDIHFRSGPGLTALFGRSGTGKTSIVNVIAGLVRPEKGRIVVDGSVLIDTERGILVPAHRRRPPKSAVRTVVRDWLQTDGSA